MTGNEGEPGAVYCAFTNGFGEAHRNPYVQLVCAEAAMADNPANEPSPSQRALTEDHLTLFGSMDRKDIEVASLIFNVGRRWKSGRTIKVGFIDGPEWARKDVLEVARQWCKYANLELARENNLAAAEVRITFRPGGSWSMLGNGALGVKQGPTMQLGWYVNRPGQAVVLHEFGHVLAFPHEQFHPKRECKYDERAVIRDLSGPPNNWSLAQIRGNVLRPPWGGDTYTAYDPDSIMHYSQPAHWFTTPGCAVEFNSALSRLDKRGAALWYPRPALEMVVDSAVTALGV